MITRRAMVLGAGSTGLLVGCGAAPATLSTSSGITGLESAILALGPNVDPAEAARAARMAYAVTADLVREYEIVDTPLVHNAKVNVGLKKRGLCYHWARDIQTRMTHARYVTLEFNRLVANAENPFRLEHSTAVVFARGDSWKNGIVLDPWRTGGTLHWDQVRDDTKYDWKLRADIPVRRRGTNVTLARAEE
ncbi:hypothetical protein [Roseovarius sp. Pro17]|uniref:hypothetical protein n=1 Tax=Roseovarius sp. Pro17 TaxID=3108175 RepID=UPI002D79AF12|nr:hypothetical protein [Roseovarius sp. Pro17]